MNFYKCDCADDIWEIGSPVIIGIFIEDATQELLNSVKENMSEVIEPASIHTIFFTETAFGALIVDEGYSFKAEHWDSPPDDITKMEDECIGILFKLLDGKRWDALWFKNLFSDDMTSMEKEFDGLANHVIGYTSNDDKFCFVSTNDKDNAVLLFFKNMFGVVDEAEPVLNEEVPPQQEET
ncbi:MAG: hypothetical protein NC548_29700 [Lachnospiraceae bacterium]|nr:hypothetical protein [Lachnospiraceae bacterium]